MEKWADLHIHTFYSDSTSSPQEVLKQAFDCNINCIAITDHDTIEGVLPTQELSVEYGIEVIPGIEFSTDWQGRDVHMLAYLYDMHHPMFIERLKYIQDMRVERMKKMIQKLKDLYNIEVDFEEVAALTKSRSVGRLHLATILLKKNRVGSIKEAFDKFLADSSPVYVADFKPTPFEIIELVREAGGLSVLAHPMVTNVDELISPLASAGLNGLEVYYPNTGENMVEHYSKLADKYNLIKTGGSDAHGQAKRNTFIGRLKIPYDIVEHLKSLK
jgi:predicted metal-dependent phosphoesterase TrpH